MRSVKFFTVPFAASLLLGAVAHATDAPGLPWNSGSVQQVAVMEPGRYPELHWTTVIGTGTAASLGRSEGSFEPVPLVAAQHDSEPDWTAAIGAGSAASLERRM
jgi:hypothetical protein